MRVLLLNCRSPGVWLYPENRDKDNVSHSFDFIEGLTAGYTFPEAHRRVLVTDQTPDVPLQTSDIYLEKLLDGAARARGRISTP